CSIKIFLFFIIPKLLDKLSTCSSHLTFPHKSDIMNRKKRPTNKVSETGSSQDNLFLLNNLQIQRRQMRDEQYSRRL
ncbi:MAG: hypothetical protein ACYS8S_04500, partial [Planctomycetota bacterium]